MHRGAPASLLIGSLLLAGVLNVPLAHAAGLSDLPIVGGPLTAIEHFLTNLFAPIPGTSAPVAAVDTARITAPQPNSSPQSNGAPQTATSSGATQLTGHDTVAPSAAAAPADNTYVTQAALDHDLAGLTASLNRFLLGAVGNIGPAHEPDTIQHGVSITSTAGAFGSASINDLTVNGVTGLKTADIPDLSGTYLSLAGGIVSGSFNVAAPGTVTQRSEISQSPAVNVTEGYAFDGTYNYLFSQNEIDKRNNDETWSLVASNNNPLSGISGVNHQGDADVYDGSLYVPVEQYSSCSAFSNQNIAIFSASDLSLMSVHDISAQGAEISGLAVAPDIGMDGTIFVSSFCDANHIYEYDLQTFAYLGTLALQSPISYAQGIAYQNGTLYVDGSPDNNQGILYSVKPSTGSVQQLYVTPIVGEPEGLDGHRAGEIGWLINPGSNDTVHFIAPATSASIPFFTVTSTGNVGVGTSSPYAQLAIVSTGTSTTSRAFLVNNSANAPLLSVNDGGFVGVGTSYPLDSQLDITSSAFGSFESIIRMTTTGGTKNGDFFLGPTDNSWSIGGDKLIFGAGTPGSGDVKMVMTSSGQLGIGTTSPENSAKLAITDSTAVAAIPDLVLSQSATGGSDWYFWSTNSNNLSGGGKLLINNSNATASGKFTIDSSGRVGIGTTNPYSRLQVTGPNTASTSAFAVVNSASTTEFSVSDAGSAVLSGSLTQNSDQRLKTNVESLDASSSLTAIEALNPVSFNWIDGVFGAGDQLGFIAQQVQEQFPQLVSTTSPTALTPDGTLGLNYSGLIAPIVGAIKEIAGEIASLEQTVAGFANSFTSKRVTTDQLCVDDVCVTRDQFLRMVEQSGQTPTTPATPTTTDTSEQGSAPAQITHATTTPAAPDTVSDASSTPPDASTTSAADASGQGSASTETTDASSSPAS